MKNQSVTTCLAIFGALAQLTLTAATLQIYTAVELEFRTQQGHSYQLEASSNLAEWAPFGSRIEGTEGRFNFMVSTRETGKRFFRLIDLDLTPGLAAFYRLDGNAVDSTTNRNHGTALGVAATTNRFGVSGGALYFSGSWTSYISIADSPSLDITDAITLAAWVNFEVGGYSNPRIVHKHMYELFMYDAERAVRRPAFQLFDVGSISTAPALYAEQWMFVAGTFDGTTFKLYVNGVLASSITRTPATIATNSQAVNIGRNGGNFDDVYQGIIDDVRIYNRALSGAEILELFHATE